MSISRSKDLLVLREFFVYIMSNFTTCFKDSTDETLCKHLPVVMMKQFNRHVAAPLLMPGFKDLSKTPRADHRPVRQAGVFDQRRSQLAGQCHSLLEEEIKLSQVMTNLLQNNAMHCSSEIK